MANNPSRSWASIDGMLWFTIIANGASHSQTNNQTANGYCWDFNFKCFCTRQNCFYRHVCLKCGLAHPFAYCQQNPNRNTNTHFNRPQFSGSVRSIRQAPPRPQQNVLRAPPAIQAPRQNFSRFPILRLPRQSNNIY